MRVLESCPVGGNGIAVTSGTLQPHSDELNLAPAEGRFAETATTVVIKGFPLTKGIKKAQEAKLFVCGNFEIAGSRGHARALCGIGKLMTIGRRPESYVGERPILRAYPGRA